MTLDFKKQLLILVGPTASGKTEVAFEIAEILPVEIISCDSMQVYRSMPITTQAPVSFKKHGRAKPSVHLVSFLSPTHEYNAAIFRKQALSLIEKVAKNKTPLLVGGTGLYLRALLDGLFEAEGALPLKDQRLRKKLLKEQERFGGNFLHEKLAEVDPPSAAKIHPHDLRRIVRALEVFHLTHKPLSLQQPRRQGIRYQFIHKVFLLNPEREDLYERINRRVECMIRQGLAKEVKGLLKKKLSLTAQSALGIKEIRGFLERRTTLETAVELLKKNTRNYAKRQLSWFRHERGAEAVGVARSDTPKKIALEIVGRWENFTKEVAE